MSGSREAALGRGSMEEIDGSLYYLSIAFVAIVCVSFLVVYVDGVLLAGGDGILNDRSSAANLVASSETKKRANEEREERRSASNNDSSNGWKCACEGGGIFFPPSLKGPAAVVRMGAGGCYHKEM